MKDLEIAKQALLFYSRMEFHPREVCIKTIIDDDNGETARKALELIAPDLTKPFFDEDN